MSDRASGATVAIEVASFGIGQPLISDLGDVPWVPGQSTPAGGWVKADTVKPAPAPTEMLPPPPADELTQLLAKVASDDRMVVATSTDYGYLSMTKNWICHLRKLGLADKVLVFSLDEKIHQAVLDMGVASYFEAGMAKEADAVGNWNSKSYNQVVHTKTKHQHAVLKRGYNLFFADIDIPWLDDYRTQVVRDVPPGVDFVGQQNWPQNDMNVGFFYARSTPTMVTFFANVIELEILIEQKKIALGGDPRKDVFDPSDDQSVIAFNMICGFPNGSYPGRGNFGAPAGGHPQNNPNNTIKEVQPKWQRRTLNQRHGLSSGKVRRLDRTRVWDADCSATTGLVFKYGFFPPKWYQTGHKNWKAQKLDGDIYTNGSTMYHPNFMKGKEIKITSLTSYGRWHEECDAAGNFL